MNFFACFHTLDDKGPLVAAMMAGKIIKDVIGEKNIRGILQVAGLLDEETTDPDGVDFGIEYLLEEERLKSVCSCFYHKTARKQADILSSSHAELQEAFEKA